MKIQIDENNYIMGYATVGEITEGIDVEYDEAVFEYGFAFYKYENGKIIFDEDKYNQCIENEEKQRQKEELQIQIEEVAEWLKNYDKEYAAYERCKRLGIIYDGDIETLNAQAAEKQNQCNGLKNQLKSLN